MVRLRVGKLSTGIGRIRPRPVPEDPTLDACICRDTERYGFEDCEDQAPFSPTWALLSDIGRVEYHHSAKNTANRNAKNCHRIVRSTRGNKADLRLSVAR